jgi:hypothetical protein
MGESEAVEIESSDGCDLWVVFSELERSRISERKARIEEKRQFLRGLEREWEREELPKSDQILQKFDVVLKKLERQCFESRRLAVLQEERSRLVFECTRLSEQETEYRRLIRDQERRDEEWQWTKQRIQKKGAEVTAAQECITRRSQELRQRRERLERNKVRAAAYTERMAHLTEKLEQKRVLLRNMESRVDREIHRPQAPQAQSRSSSGLSKSLDLNENSPSNSLITTSPNARQS